MNSLTSNQQWAFNNCAFIQCDRFNVNWIFSGAFLVNAIIEIHHWLHCDFAIYQWTDYDDGIFSNGFHENCYKNYGKNWNHLKFGNSALIHFWNTILNLNHEGNIVGFFFFLESLYIYLSCLTVSSNLERMETRITRTKSKWIFICRVLNTIFLLI